MHVLVWLFSNFSRQKNPTADSLDIDFIGTIVPIKCTAIFFCAFVLKNLKTTKQEHAQHFPNVKLK